MCPSDSESDMEVLSMRRPHRRLGAESEDERPLRSSFSVSKASNSQPKGLRRTFSSQGESQYTSNLENEVVVLENKSEKDNTEDIVEEKTIGAVFDQMKQSLRLEPPMADVGMTDLLDSMRSEVRRAVADIRMELEESLQRNETGSPTADCGNRRGSEGTIVIRSVADIQKEYSTKLEESERRVQELRSQIAVEERRCLELSKIVKELLPTPPPVNLEISTPQAASSGRRPFRRKNSAERQIVVESLDVEAQKYFEECVSISSFDCHVDSDDSVLEKENITVVRKSRPSDGETNAKVISGESGIKGDAHSRDLSVGSDGVVLPWLKWEAEAGGAVEKNPKQGTKKHTSPKSSSTGGRGGFSRVAGSSDQFYRSSSAKSNTAKRPGSSESLSDQLGAFPNMPLFSIDDQVVQADHHLDVDSLLFDKIQFQCRVNNGELLLCQGMFLM